MARNSSAYRRIVTRRARPALIVIALLLLCSGGCGPDVSGLQEKVWAKNLFGALLFGLVSGLVASQCATPVLAAILTYVMAKKESLLYGAVLLFIYALGRGVPIVLAGTFTGAMKGIRSFGKWSEFLEKASGVVILLVGFYFIWIA